VRILLSAYSCEPNAGSEPGAGYAIVLAAAAIGPCWVITRQNNVDAVEEALGRDDPEHAVTLIGLDGPRWTLAVKRRLGVHRLYYVYWQRLVSRRAQRLVAEVGGFDVVHHATMSPFWQPIGVANLDGGLVVGPVGGGTSTPFPLLRTMSLVPLLYEVSRFVANRAFGWLRGSKLRAAEVVISQNPVMTRVLVHWLAVDSRRIITHPNASDAPLDLLPGGTQRQPVVLFVGKLVEFKGVLLAVDAFQFVTHPGSQLVFVGAGPARSHIERRARDLGIPERVGFRGQLPRDDVLRLMNEASCLLFPSFHDEAPFVVAEALSLGLPVVCLDQGGTAALVSLWPEAPAAVVTPGQPEATARALARHVQHFLAHPAIHPAVRQKPTTSMQMVLEKAYSMARGE
jgi:glycosyltransferase involved in cell wall biosynthesis